MYLTMFMSDLCENVGSGDFHTNHSLRETATTKLFEPGNAMQLTTGNAQQNGPLISQTHGYILYVYYYLKGGQICIHVANFCKY